MDERDEEMTNTHDENEMHDSTTGDGESHATTGGAAGAGLVTGGVVGFLGGGPAGAAIGAIGGAIVGAASERVMHHDDDTERAEAGLDNDHDRNPMIEDRAHASSDIGTTGPTTSTSTSAGDTMQLREEEIQARKRQVQTGELHVGKDVVSEQRRMDVPVTREEVYVERQPVDRRPSDRPIEDTAGQTIDTTVRAEQVEVSKRPVVYEQVGVGKREVTETQPVSGTVRREELRVQHEGDTGMRSSSTGTWDQVMPTYQQRWQQSHGMSGGRWEDYEPAYNYGWEMHNRPEYRGRSWSDAEGDLQRDWTSRNPSTPWDRARDAIRETWE